MLGGWKSAKCTWSMSSLNSKATCLKVCDGNSKRLLKNLAREKSPVAQRIGDGSPLMSFDWPDDVGMMEDHSSAPQVYQTKGYRPMRRLRIWLELIIAMNDDHDLIVGVALDGMVHFVDRVYRIERRHSWRFMLRTDAANY